MTLFIVQYTAPLSVAVLLVNLRLISDLHVPLIDSLELPLEPTVPPSSTALLSLKVTFELS